MFDNLLKKVRTDRQPILKYGLRPVVLGSSEFGIVLGLVKLATQP